MAWADDIRSKVDIVDAIGEYVQLKPAGRAQWKACCPLHNETKPSFSVNAEKGVWYCFGCKKGGDVVKFIQEIESLDFREALEFLGHKYHIPDPGTPAAGRTSGEGRLRAEGREALHRVHEEAAAFYHNILVNTSMGAEARRYLEKRGIGIEAWRKFMLGAATDGWEDLSRELLRKGARESDLLSAGLSSKRRDGTGVVDRFRNRIIYPIKNPSGRFAAFGARALGNEEPKYLNSSNSPIYNKSDALYWLSDAKRAIATLGYAVLVEGYMDVIALVQAGIENVVASCGTAMTEAHLKVLFRYTRNVVIAFDGDGAGRDAAVRTAALVVAAGAVPRIAQLPDGADPDDFVRKNGGGALRERIEKAVDPAAFVLDMLGANASGSAREKEEWIARLAPIASLAAPLIRAEFVRTIAGRLGIAAGAADALLIAHAQTGGNPAARAAGAAGKSTLLSPRLMTEAAVLAGILREPANLRTALDAGLSDADFETRAAKCAWRVLSSESDPARWDAALLSSEAGAEGAAELYGIITDAGRFPHQRDFAKRVERLISLRAASGEAAILRKLAEAEKAGDSESVARLARELAELRRAGKVAGQAD
ncbi:MAG: DNA primase [bacterium]